MKSIEITMEKVIRATRKFEVSDEEYNAILSDGICPRWDEMQQALLDTDTEYLKTKDPSNGDVEFDYCIWDEEDRKLVEWG